MLATLLLLALAQAAPVQDASDLRSVLYRQNAPARVKDLGAGWYSATLVRKQGLGSGSLIGVFQGVAGDGLQRTRIITRGEIVTLGDRKLLVAYRIAAPSTNYLALLNRLDADHSGSQDAANVLEMVAPAPTPESELKLDMIDLRTALGLDGIAPFDPAHLSRDDMDLAQTAIQAAVLFPVFAQARAKARAISSVSNMKQIALGMLMYCQDFDETLPPMANLAQMKRATFAYVKNDEIFKCPIPGVVYVTNPKASKVNMAAIESPAAFILIYESKPDTAGTRGVAYSDGHVKRVKEADWPEVWKKGELPYRQ